MRKASNTLIVIGVIVTVLTFFTYVLFTFASFRISLPSYTASLIEQINDGSVTKIIEGSAEENAAYIQHIFLIIGIVLVIYSVLVAASIVIIEIARHKQTKLFYILTTVLGGVTLNILFILSGVFGLIANKQDNDTETVYINY